MLKEVFIESLPIEIKFWINICYVMILFACICCDAHKVFIWFFLYYFIVYFYFTHHIRIDGTLSHQRPHSHQVHSCPLWSYHSMPTCLLILSQTRWYWTLGRSLPMLLSTSIDTWGTSFPLLNLLMLLYKLLEGCACKVCACQFHGNSHSVHNLF